VTNESKQSPKSGNPVSESTPTPKSEPEIVVSGVVRLRSLLEGGGDHAGSGLSVPKKGVIFEADARGHELVAAGLAEVVAPEGAKGE
jgi:hypothetical protein